MFHEDWYYDYQIDNLVELVKTVKHLEGLTIEIGCWEGKSTINLANHCFPDILICNDTWLGNIQESLCTGNTHITELLLKERDVFSTFVDNMENHTQKNYKIVKKDCIEWLKTVDQPIKFIHIDASHEYESVHETIRLALPRMVKGGIMCGDDYESANITRFDLHGGVERAVRELLPNHHNKYNLWYCVIE
jgi:hypothetical protein